MDHRTKTEAVKPGERVFNLVLLALGIYITIESWKMYRESPSLSGYGTVPLICGILLTVLSAYALVRAFMAPGGIAGLSFRRKTMAVVRHLFSIDVLVTLLLIIAYCVSMAAGAPFVIATPVFLWISMTYLRRGAYLRNVLYTALVFAFVYLIFHVGFNVVLP